MPRDTAWRNVIKSIIADQIKAEGLTLLGWRDVPTDNSSLGVTVKPTEPAYMQVFIGRNGTAKTEDEFERRLYILRKSISQAIYQRRDRGLAGYYPVLDVVPHRDLQGHVPRRPARQVLSPICTRRISRARSRWCTSASRPTPSRPGRWRIPTG